MRFADIDGLAVLIAAIGSWLIGAVWYMAWAKPWMNALGKTRAELTGPSGKASPVPFIMSFIAELVMACVLAWIIGCFGSATIPTGAVTGFVAWFGFVVTTMTVNHRFAGARPTLTAIDSGHWLAVLLAQGAILGAFG